MTTSIGLRSVLFGVALACGACGGGNSGTGGNGDSDMGTVQMAPPGQLALSVEQARMTSTDGTPDYLQLAVTLSNGAGGAPAALNPVLFQVRTSDGLLHIAFGGSTDWVDGDECDASVQVGPGAHARCTLEVDLKKSTGPTELVYSAPGVTVGTGDMRTASAMLTVEPCTPCGKGTVHCTYLDRDEANCGACGNAVPNIHDATCKGGKAACTDVKETYCPAPSANFSPACVDLLTDWSNCGKCGSEVGNGMCVNGAPVCPAGKTLVTGSGNALCVDLQTDANNCGTVGFKCAEHLPVSITSQECRAGKCGGESSFDSSSAAPYSCTQQCAKSGLTCDDTWFTSGTTKGGALQEPNTIYSCAYMNKVNGPTIDCGCSN